MEIYPLGHSSYKLRGKAATVVTDPYDPQTLGLKFPPHVTCDIMTISHAHQDHNYTKLIEGDKLLFTGPGEYEAKGVEILGVATWHDAKGGAERGKNTIFKIDIDGVSIVHCGDLGHRLSEDQEELLDGVDVLLIPCGGTYTIDAKTAAAVATALEPKIIMPMHYQRPGLSPKVFDHLTPVSLFLKEVGKEGIAPQPKLKITKDTLPQETQVIVLE